MNKKIFLVIILSLLPIGSNLLVAANRQEHAAAGSEISCGVCLSNAEPLIETSDYRAVWCGGATCALIIYPSLESLAVSVKGHGLHVACLCVWLQTQNNCPICRKEFNNEERVLLGVPPLPAQQTVFEDGGNLVHEDAFITAAAMGDEARVRYFLRNGMSVNITDGLGRTPLHLAVGGGFLDVSRVLLSDVNINVNQQDRAFKATPLLRAVENICNPFIIQELLLAGALPNIRGAFGNTALHKAVLNSCNMIIKILLDAHAEVNAQNEFGNTPLHNAANRGAVGATRLLLGYGARKDIVNSRGQTPYAVAMARGYVEAAVLLA